MNTSTHFSIVSYRSTEVVQYQSSNFPQPKAINKKIRYATLTEEDKEKFAKFAQEGRCLGFIKRELGIERGTDAKELLAIWDKDIQPLYPHIELDKRGYFKWTEKHENVVLKGLKENKDLATITQQLNEADPGWIFTVKLVKNRLNQVPANLKFWNGVQESNSPQVLGNKRLHDGEQSSPSKRLNASKGPNDTTLPSFSEICLPSSPLQHVQPHSPFSSTSIEVKMQITPLVVKKIVDLSKSGLSPLEIAEKVNAAEINMIENAQALSGLVQLSE